MSNALPQHDTSRGHDASRGLAMLTTALGPSIAAMLDAPDTIEVEPAAVTVMVGTNNNNKDKKTTILRSKEVSHG